MSENLVAFVEYLGGAATILAMGRWLYVRDAAAAERCAETVCKFRSVLEKFGKHLRNSSRHPDQDLPKLLELELLLQELRLKKRGLLFKPRFLNSGIRESLKLFSRLNILSPASKPYMIAAELTVEWGIPTVAPYEAVKLIAIQGILEKPSLFRWVSGIISWMKPLFDKIPFRFRRIEI